MKRIFASILSAALLLTACQKSDLSTPSSEGGVLYATIAEVAATKTYMDVNNNIRWSEGDQIVGFMKSSLGLKYQILPSSVGKTYASFENISGSNDYVNAGTEWGHNVVYYPYSDVVEAQKLGSNYSLSVSLPAEQTYAESSFGNGSMAMVAVNETNNITFKNVLGGMKLQLKGSQKVTSIQLVGKNSEKLSGAATVTAYTDETKPAITMSSGASTSVTLDCGSGVQLNESTATDFIIALPPVLFNNGFTVTVTDSESQTYTVETDNANTVLRSSLLVMPAVTLTASGGDDSEEDDDATYIEYVFLSMSSLTMMPNTSYTLVADIDPIDVTYPTLTWSSSDNSVAEVDQNGKVTAKSDGNVTITALAVGGERASCSVTVKTPKTFAEGDYVDYVDELGVNHGKGIAVAGVIWAPVNCGYEPATADYKGYPYGKLYQWGRKYGQGYNRNDASYPSGDNMIEGPVMPSWGSSETYKDAFFYGSSDWCNQQIDDLWVDGEGKKTKKDPCPTGWRVPTYYELDALRKNYSWSAKDNQIGSYFVGEYTYIDGLPQVFFPAAGYRLYDCGADSNRGYRGNYWSSRPYSYGACSLNFSNGDAGMYYFSYRAYGYSVRCVQVTDEVAEL